MRKALSTLLIVLWAGTGLVCAANGASIKMPATAPTDVQLAIKLLQSSEPEDRAQAAYWIGTYGAEAIPAIPYLIRLLSDPANPVPLDLDTACGPTSPKYEAMQALGVMGGVAIPDLLKVLKGPDKTAARMIVQNLGNSYRAASGKDDSYYLTWTVASILGDMKREEVVKPAREALANGDVEVRRSAVRVLASVGSDEAIDALISCFKDNDSQVRNAAVRELCRLKDRRVVEPLTALLGSESDIEVVASIVYAYGEIGDSRAIEPLKKLMSHHDWFVRCYAAEVLVKLGDRSPCETLARELKSASPQMDGYVAESISKVNDPEVIEAAVTAIQEGRNTLLAAKALVRATDPRATTAMIGLLGSSTGEVFETAAQCLGAGSSPEALDSLISLLGSPDEQRRDRAVWALAERGDKRAEIALLGALLTTKDRRSILYALTRTFVGDEAQNTLIAALKDDEASNRWQIVNLLSWIKTDRSVAALASALDDHNPGVRSAAARSLGMIGTRAAVDVLIAELMDPNSYIRPDAVVALAWTQDARVTGYLRAALSDKSDAVRRQAVLALDARATPGAGRAYGYGFGPAMSIFSRSDPMHERDKRPVKELVKVLSSPDEAERLGAARALQLRKDRSSVGPLIRALQKDDSSEVRIAAAYALKGIGDPRAVAPMLKIVKTEPQRVSEKPLMKADRAILEAVVSLLDSGDKQVADCAKAALKSMTLQDFGADKHKWSEWVKANVER